MADHVKLICKRTVVSTKAVPPGKSYPLSTLDCLMEQNHVKIVYYYRCPKSTKPGETTKKLRESLAETLTNFPVATGRLVRDEGGKWVVKCNDAGVRTVEGRVKGSLEEWLRRVDREKELKLVYWEDMYHKPYFWSTFYVQLTEFEDGGLAIGLCCTHLLADPICATMFIKAWADTTLAGTMTAPPFFHPLPPRRPGNTNPSNKPYTHFINHCYKSCIEKSPPYIKTTNHVATVALLFSDPMVRACMATAQPGGTASSAVSPFVALTGLFWVCVSKVKGITNGLVDMSICLDVRKVLGLDKGYFGNCMIYNKIPYTKEYKLYDAIELIGDVTSKMDYEGIIDLIEWLRYKDHELMLINASDLICVNLENTVDPRLMMFEEGFTPIRGSYYVEGTSYGLGQVVILPSQEAEGAMSRVVMVTLPEDEMVKVMEDELIRSFSPVVLMGINC